MHTSSRAAFEAQKVRVSTRRTQARITESTEQKSIWALRAVGGRAPTRNGIILISVHSVILARFYHENRPGGARARPGFPTVRLPSRTAIFTHGGAAARRPLANSVLESLLSWIRPRSGRTPMSLAPGRRPRAKEELSNTEPNQISRREPGDPWPDSGCATLVGSNPRTTPESKIRRPARLSRRPCGPAGPRRRRILTWRQGPLVYRSCDTIRAIISRTKHAISPRSHEDHEQES
jgi:hypothetical protein